MTKPSIMAYCFTHRRKHLLKDYDIVKRGNSLFAHGKAEGCPHMLWKIVPRDFGHE